MSQLQALEFHPERRITVWVDSVRFPCIRVVSFQVLRFPGTTQYAPLHRFLVGTCVCTQWTGIPSRVLSCSMQSVSRIDLRSGLSANTEGECIYSPPIQRFVKKKKNKLRAVLRITTSITFEMTPVTFHVLIQLHGVRSDPSSRPVSSFLQSEVVFTVTQASRTVHYSLPSFLSRAGTWQIWML